MPGRSSSTGGRGSSGARPTRAGSPPTPDRTAGAPDELVTEFRAVLDRDPALIPSGARVLIALSGGGDSLALLRLVREVSGPLRLELQAAHFDHGLRAGSRSDADRVREMSEAIDVPCTVRRASGLGGGQAEYRRARLAFLDEVADDIGADRIALAHQLEDQLETLVLRLLRGTGLRGLGGIPSRRGRFVRPLLGIRRERLQTYLGRGGVSWIDDESNRDPRYARGRVRHGVLPLLRRAAGDVEEAPGGGGLDEILLEMSADARRVDAALDARALREVRPTVHVTGAMADTASAGAQIARFGLSDYDPAVLARLLRILARNKGIRLSRGGTRLGVEFIRRGSSGHAVDLGGGLRLSREYECFRLDRVAEGGTRPDRELAIESGAAGQGTAKLGGRVYEVAWGEEPDDRSTWLIHLDAAAVSFPLRLRGPRPGDRIRTGAGSRKVKKLLNERRVPLSRRGQVPVLESADGRVLWVAGHGTALGSAERTEECTFRVGVARTEADGS